MRRWYIPFAFGGFIMTFAGVAPGDAVSNLALWVKLLGVEHPPDWLASQVTDDYVFWGGLAMMILALGSFVWPWLRKKFRHTEITPTDETKIGSKGIHSPEGKQELVQKLKPDAQTVSEESSIETTHSPFISLIDLMREAEKVGWRFTDDGSQHIFDFVHALRDAGSTKAIQFWGREKQRIDLMTKDQALADIDPRYWLKFKIDGISCLKISHSTGEAQGIASDNLKTITGDDGNITQHRLYADIQLNRKQALDWLARNQILTENSTPFSLWLDYIEHVMRVAQELLERQGPINADVMAWIKRTYKGLRTSLGDENSKKFSEFVDDGALTLYPNQSDSEKIMLDSCLEELKRLKENITPYDLSPRFDAIDLERYQ